MPSAVGVVRTQRKNPRYDPIGTRSTASKREALVQPSSAIAASDLRTQYLEKLEREVSILGSNVMSAKNCGASSNIVGGLMLNAWRQMFKYQLERDGLRSVVAVPRLAPRTNATQPASSAPEPNQYTPSRSATKRRASPLCPVRYRNAVRKLAPQPIGFTRVCPARRAQCGAKGVVACPARWEEAQPLIEGCTGTCGDSTIDVDAADEAEVEAEILGIKPVPARAVHIRVLELREE